MDSGRSAAADCPGRRILRAPTAETELGRYTQTETALEG